MKTANIKINKKETPNHSVQEVVIKFCFLLCALIVLQYITSVYIHIYAGMYEAYSLYFVYTITITAMSIMRYFAVNAANTHA